MMNGGNGMYNFGFGSLEDFMNAMNNMQSQQAAGNGAAFSGQNQRQGGNGGRGKGILGQYGINLTDLARQGKIDPVIGRDKSGDHTRNAAVNIILPDGGQYKTLQLAPDSHVAKLIARIDDEAHRFAVTYHSLLKRKKMLK